MGKKLLNLSFVSGKKPIKRRTILILSFLVLSIIFSVIIVHMCFSRMNRRVENTRQFAASEEYKISYAIESRITTAKALEMHVLSHNGDTSDFAQVANFYYTDDPALRSIQLAPNGVVKKELMYPKDDTDFQEHDLFADPERKADAEKARDTGEVTLSGPYELLQGGKGIIVRNPIYLEDEHGQKDFWGFSIVVFNVPEVFNIEQMNLLSSENYYYRLWSHLPDSEETQVIVENTNKELKNAIREEIKVYDTVWYLDIVPQDNWLPRNLLAMLIVAFSVILFLSMIGISSHLKVRELVYYDSLLNIGNMNALSVFYENLSGNAMEKMFVVAFDVDKFKEFNYIYGSAEGDRLLRYISETIQEVPQTAIFRYAFDYFIILKAFEDLQECEQQVELMLQRFSRDIEDGVVPPFEISAGIRKIHQGESLQLVINDALIAREEIKGNALRHYAFYDEEIRSKRLSYMEMESNLPAAIQNKEFHVYYQPKYNMITGEIIGAEALVRWIKPDGTMIGPGAFIPCFEESHQISLLDEIVLKEVCREMNEMIKQGLAVKPVSVNLSRVHLKDSGFLSKIEKIINDFHIDPSMLSFEITESAIYEDSIPLRSIVEHLHSLGCQVDMDDYGVGVSGPKSLASYRFDTVKFDKSFVDDIRNPKVADIIRSTSYLVKQWGMKVIVEGVETKDQARHLVGLGCTSAQGFYYSKPIPSADYRKLLKPSHEEWFHNEHRMDVRTNFFSEDVRALFDSNLLPTYIINPKNYRVVYCNSTMQKVIGEDVTGGLCYEKMRGEDGPCENCSAMRLYQNGDGSPREHLSRKGIWTMVQASLLHWQGRDYIQISCMDITRQKQLEEQLRQRNGDA